MTIQTLVLGAIFFCTAIVAQETRQIYHVQGLRSVFDLMEETYPGQLDIWKQYELRNPALASDSDPLVDMTLYITPSFAEILRTNLVTKSSSFALREESSVDIHALIQQERDMTAACRESTKHRVFSANDLKSNEFFDCFRPDVEIFEFLDKMVSAHGSILSKFDISKTIENRIIPGFKLAIDNKPRRALFIQGMLHAREWLSVPTVIYTMASLIDGYTAKDSAIMKVLEEYNFYFVPLVNIDGYRYTWAKDRMWRKNRRQHGRGFWGNRSLRAMQWWNNDGVDLNRNYGPAEHFCRKGASKQKSSQTYCGTAPFSEPETAGLDAFIQTHADIAGAIDVHTYGNMVLRPYGLSNNPTDEPHRTKLKTLGKNVADAVNSYAKGKYTNIRASELYVACGTMMDSMFETYGMPAITFELRGRNFVVDPSLIRTAGPEIFKGIQVFTKEVSDY